LELRVLAKERLIILLAGAGFVALRLTVALAISRDWKAYGVGFLVSIGIIVALLPALRRWKSSDEDPAKTVIKRQVEYHISSRVSAMKLG
jgi:hypothetical protein